MKRNMIQTGDGSNTLFVPGLGEHYHSRHGAITESNHIFIDAAFRHSDRDPVRIIEFGMGTGLNILLTFYAALEESRTVHYHTIEKYPLTEFEITNLGYCEQMKGTCAQLFTQIHSCNWGIPQALSDTFTLQKIREDFKLFQSHEKFDVIYFDPFAPEVQPDLWTENMFRKIASFSSRGAVLTTYSCKGSVKRNLKAAGFSIDKLPGPPGKREFLRAVLKA